MADDDGLEGETAVYARMSTKEQQSVEWQVGWARELARDKGWRLVHEYQEKGGHSDDLSLKGRPQLRRLFEDCKAGRIYRVAVWDRTRLARGEDLILLLEAFSKFGVKVYIGDIAGEYGDNTELVIDFLRVFDKYFLRSLRKNTKRGMAAAREKGTHVGRPPIGFKINKDGKVVVEEWAERLVAACDERGAKAVCESKQFVTPRGKYAGKPLSLTGIRRVVRNVRAFDVSEAVAASSKATKERYATMKRIRDEDAHEFRKEIRELMGPSSERVSV